MSAVALGVGAAVSVAGSVASSQIQKNASGKAAKAQGKASQKAAQTQEMWARYANQIAEQNLRRQKLEDQGYTDISRADLSPYADAGRSTLNQLMGLLQPRQASPARAAIGTDPAEAARRTAEWQDISAKYDAGQQAIEDAKQALNQVIPTGNMQAITQAQQAYVNAQHAVEAINTDYWNKKAQFTGIQKYTPAQAAVSAAEAQKAQDDAINRKFNARDYMLDPTTGGKPPPDLTKNFDMDAWLKEQGKTQQDLTQNFDVNKFLGQAGMTEADLFRKFTQEDYVEDPGYQFRLEQGLKGLENTAAFKGGLLSGATQKALNEYNSGQASQEYGAAFNRFGQQQETARGAATTAFNQFGSNRQNLQTEAQRAFGNFNINRANASDVYQNAYSRWTDQNQNIYNRLMGLVNVGQNAATNQAGYVQNQAGRALDYNQNFNRTQQQNFANISGAQSGNLERQGDIQANRYAANAQATNNMVQGIGNAVSSGVGQYIQSKYQNNLLELLKSGNQQSNIVDHGRTNHPATDYGREIGW